MVSLVFALVRGAGRTLICGICEYSEIVPLESPRAKRVALASQVEIVKNSAPPQ